MNVVVFSILVILIVVLIICKCKEKFQDANPEELYETEYGEKSSQNMSETELNYSEEINLPRGFKQNEDKNIYQCSIY
jgi:hypothetical protein